MAITHELSDPLERDVAAGTSVVQLAVCVLLDKVSFGGCRHKRAHASAVRQPLRAASSWRSCMAKRKRTSRRSGLVGRAVSAGRRARKEAESRVPPDLRRHLERRLKDADKTARVAIKQLQTQVKKASTRADVNSVRKRIDSLTKQARQVARGTGARATSTRRRAASTTKRAASRTRKAAGTARRKVAPRAAPTRRAASTPRAAAARRTTTRRAPSRRARPAPTSAPVMPETPLFTPEAGGGMGSGEGFQG